MIETYENEPISQRQLAKRFRVAPSFVTKLLKQHRETGQLDPKRQPGRPKMLKPEHLEVVQALVKTQPDLTLGELCQALKEKESIQVSEPTMCRVLKQLNLTRKKKISASRGQGK